MPLHYDVITPTMHTIAREVFSLGEDWYLAGGTALSLQLGHRESVDLDYFSQKSFDTEQLKEILSHLWSDRTWRVTYEAPQTLWCVVDGVKISFIMRTVALLTPVLASPDFRLANVSDITVMKLLAICSREEYKDYFDLACIATMTDVRQWVSWWQKVYPTQDMISWLIALGQITEIVVIPLQIHEDFTKVDPVLKLTKTVHEIQSFIQTV